MRKEISDSPAWQVQTRGSARGGTGADRGSVQKRREGQSLSDCCKVPEIKKVDTYLKVRSEMSEQEGIQGADNGWFEEKGHIYHCYIFENELQKVQVL